MKKIVGISLFIFWSVVTALLVAGLLFYQKDPDNGLVPPPSSLLPDGTGTIVLNTPEIGKHNSVSDCWMVIDGKVYNLTGYLGLHPGGAVSMLPYCGKDGSQGFATKDQGKSQAHSSNATSLLASYYLGNLNQKISASPTPSASSAPTSVPTQSTPTGVPGTNVVLNAQEIAKHNSAGNCWLIISGKVYNVTAYLGAHPGGVGAISPYCGKDGTQAFLGLPHSSNATSLLASYYLGNLNQKISASPTPSASSAPTSVPTQSTPTGVPGTNVVLNAQEIAKHNSAGNCWLIISGKVYNVTAYLGAHPGGVGAISPYCGKDGTQAFLGLPHSSNATSLLASYYLGNFNQTADISQNPQTTVQPTPPPRRGGDDDDD